MRTLLILILYSHTVSHPHPHSLPHSFSHIVSHSVYRSVSHSVLRIARVSMFFSCLPNPPRA